MSNAKSICSFLELPFVLFSIFGLLMNLTSFGLQKAHCSRCRNAVHAGGRENGWLRRRELPRKGEHGTEVSMTTGALQMSVRSSERTAGRPRDTLLCRGGRCAEVWKLESGDPVTRIS